MALADEIYSLTKEFRLARLSRLFDWTNLFRLSGPAIRPTGMGAEGIRHPNRRKHSLKLSSTRIIGNFFIPLTLRLPEIAKRNSTKKKYP